MARSRPHGESVDGTPEVGGPAGRRGEAVLAAGRLVLGLPGGPGGALQGHPSRVQAAGGRAARRVDSPHLGAAGRPERPSGRRPEAVG